MKIRGRQRQSSHIKNLLALYEMSLPLEIPEHIMDIDQLLLFFKNKEEELMSEQDAVKQVLFLK